MRVLIIGGTGLLGSVTAARLLERGHDVVVTSRSTPPPSLPGLEAVTWERLDVDQVDPEQLSSLLEACDVVAYMVGPDERRLHPMPVKEFLERVLVEAGDRVFEAVGRAGVRRLVMLGSYFVTFDRDHPDVGLAAHHPYIDARRRQTEHAIRMGDDYGVTVVNLEIPFVLGAIPGRPSVVFEQMAGRFKGLPVLPAPAGAVTITTVDQVADAVVRVLEGAGDHGDRYPVGEAAITYRDLFRLMESERGGHRPVVVTPASSIRWPTRRYKRMLEARGKSAGLDYDHIVDDILNRNVVVDVVTSRRRLGYARADLVEAARSSARYA